MSGNVWQDSRHFQFCAFVQQTLYFFRYSWAFWGDALSCLETVWSCPDLLLKLHVYLHCLLFRVSKAIVLYISVVSGARLHPASVIIPLLEIKISWFFNFFFLYFIFSFIFKHFPFTIFLSYFSLAFILPLHFFLIYLYLSFFKSFFSFLWYLIHNHWEIQFCWIV